MAQLRAVASIGNVLAAQVVVDMADKVAYLEPSANPLTVFMNKLGSTRTVQNPEFKHLEQELIGDRTQINNGGGYSDSATTFVVDDASPFVPSQLAINERTKEVYLITAVNTSTPSITVTARPWGGSAAAINDDDYLTALGTAHAEYADVGIINNRLLTAHTSYTQIFRRPFGVGGTAMSTKMYSGGELARQRKENGVEFAKAMEKSFLFNKQGTSGLTGDTPRRSFNGLVSSISTNIYAVGGTMSEANFNSNFLQSLFRYGGDTKLFMASPLLCTVLDTYGRNKLQIHEQMSTKLGVAVKEYISTHGRLLVVRHKLLEGTTWGGYGIAVDLAHVNRVVLKGRDTKLLTNRQGPGYDGIIEEYLCECAIEVLNEKTHGLVSGVTGAA